MTTRRRWVHRCDLGRRPTTTRSPRIKAQDHPRRHVWPCWTVRRVIISTATYRRVVTFTGVGCRVCGTSSWRSRKPTSSIWAVPARHHPRRYGLIRPAGRLLWSRFTIARHRRLVIIQGRWGGTDVIHWLRRATWITSPCKAASMHPGRTTARPTLPPETGTFVRLTCNPRRTKIIARRRNVNIITSAAPQRYEMLFLRAPVTSDPR